MIRSNITELVGKAIREGKYLSIEYRNKLDAITNYWISIHDITANDELYVNMFNVAKDEPILNGKIFLSGIKKAEILKFSHYEVPPTLMQRILSDTSLDVYNFNKYDSNVLEYLLECYKANNDPFLFRAHLIPSIDISELTKNNPFSLNDLQIKNIISDIYHKDYEAHVDYELAVSEFSIDIKSKGKFVVAYRKLTFDPVERTLQISNKTHFNTNFYIQGQKYSLPYYSDISSSDFESLYLNSKADALELLKSGFKSGEMLNTRPEIVVLGYSQVDISHIYDQINAEYSKGEMSIPLKAYFQNTSLLDRKNRSEPYIVLYDQKVNIDQLRTIYNALKYPVTYVQGPPGTGKTQTILNVIVNCIVNEKTLLITSNNNIPIDGILEKTQIGNYRGKEIQLPVIRLGNNKSVATALNKIKELYELETNDTPKEKLLSNLKEKAKNKNAKLLQRLEQYEQRIDAEQNLQFIQGLLSKGSYWLLEQEKENIEKKIAQLPVYNNDDFKGIFDVIKDNYELLQYFYFASLRCLKRLKNKDLVDLIEIVHLENEQDKVNEFNKWIAIDKNLDKFTKIFPIILTTNISSRRLGRSFKFETLVIDEAGQCDMATSLVPISKCKNMVLIGDTNQLKPIIVFEERINDELMRKYNICPVYNYYENSILSLYRSIDSISRNILLSYHYRCGRQIIDYSNMRFYAGKLNLSEIKNVGKVSLLTVNNLNTAKKNTQLEEAEAIVKYIEENKLSDVFIITPFRNQEEVINEYLKMAKEKGEVDSSVSCGTIHKVQGQENKTIIISTSISKTTSPRTYDWIKNNSQLLNVGATRARDHLIVVTDQAAIDILSRKDDDLFALIQYVKSNGLIEVAESTHNKFTIGYSNDSIFENEFYKTMQHYCSVRGGKFKRNVKISELFPDVKDNPLVNKKEFDAVFYEINEPKIVFELNGKEHYRNKRRIASDIIKMDLLKKMNIRYIAVPNVYVKHYEFIRELINKFNGDVFQKTLFD